MRILITADLHLKEKGENPERFNTLNKIFSYIEKENSNNPENKIEYFIFAGDTFNKDYYNYSEFDDLCSNKKINIIIIPGNHDPKISQVSFKSSNIEVIEKPKSKLIDNQKIFFIPFKIGKTMDEILAEYESSESFENSIIISHGDYLTNNISINYYESGLYMPISTSSINKFKPKYVILGHIHKAYNYGIVYYPGSPCGIDITETGKRNCIVYDTSYDKINMIEVDSEYLFYDEQLTIYPVENEIELLKKQLDEKISSWNLSNDQLKKVRLRLRLNGFTTDKKRLIAEIKRYVDQKSIKFFNEDDNKNIDSKEMNSNPSRNEILFTILKNLKEKVEQLDIDNQKINGEKVECSKEDILVKALDILFGKGYRYENFED